MPMPFRCRPPSTQSPGKCQGSMDQPSRQGSCGASKASRCHSLGGLGGMIEDAHSEGE